MPRARTFSITFVGEDGNEQTKTGVKVGTKVSELVGDSSNAILNGEQVSHDAELRANDRLEAIRKSAKGAC